MLLSKSLIPLPQPSLSFVKDSASTQSIFMKRFETTPLDCPCAHVASRVDVSQHEGQYPTSTGQEAEINELNQLARWFALAPVPCTKLPREVLWATLSHTHWETPAISSSGRKCSVQSLQKKLQHTWIHLPGTGRVNCLIPRLKQTKAIENFHPHNAITFQKQM